MQKKRSNAGALCAVLVIVAMIVGILIGILIGKSMNSKETAVQSDTSAQTQPESIAVETQSTETTEATQETVSETLENGSESEAGTVVLTVNGNKVYMEEINYYLYQQRDYYVGLYGEEPWDTVMDDGQTLAEFAKAQLLEDIVKTQLLVSQAEAYGVSMTPEISAQLADEAQKYVDNLGADICEQFGLNASAIAAVYQNGELSTAVYNAILTDLGEKAKAENAALEGAELEQAVNSAYEELFNSWKESAVIETSDTWDMIVIGSVG